MKYFIDYYVWCPNDGSSHIHLCKHEIPESLYTKLFVMNPEEATESIHRFLSSALADSHSGEWSSNDYWKLLSEQ